MVATSGRNGAEEFCLDLGLFKVGKGYLTIRQNRDAGWLTGKAQILLPPRGCREGCILKNAELL